METKTIILRPAEVVLDQFSGANNVVLQRLNFDLAAIPTIAGNDVVGELTVKD